MVTDRECAICGRHFWAVNSFHLYCSPECQREAKKANNKRYNELHKAPEIRARCVICGSEFIKHGSSKTCSDKCAAENKKRTMKECLERRKYEGWHNLGYDPNYSLTERQNMEFEARQREREKWRQGDKKALENTLKLAKECGVDRTAYVTARDSMRPDRFEEWVAAKKKEKRRQEFLNLVKEKENEGGN